MWQLISDYMRCHQEIVFISDKFDLYIKFAIVTFDRIWQNNIINLIIKRPGKTHTDNKRYEKIDFTSDCNSTNKSFLKN